MEANLTLVGWYLLVGWKNINMLSIFPPLFLSLSIFCLKYVIPDDFFQQ